MGFSTQFQKFSKRKRRVMVGDMDEGAEEELPTEDIPQNFKTFVSDAIEKYNRKSNINSVPSTLGRMPMEMFLIIPST